MDTSRRAFGSFSTGRETIRSPVPRPSTSSSSSSLTPTQSNAPSPSPYLHPPETHRTRSASSASTEAFENAATKAQAWLQTWAPRGEGRGREFLSSTLNGVAGVASTVSHGINGAVNKGVQLSEQRRSMSRPASYSGPPVAGDPSLGSPSALSGSALATSPPGPTHTMSTTAIPIGRRIHQPANFARLGNVPTSTSTVDAHVPSASSTTSTLPAPNAHRRASSNSPLQPPPGQGQAIHGPSHLNPHHHRTGSTSHVRATSFGAGTAEQMSRSSSNATGGRSLTGKSMGMPYKIGFQPGGVRNDRTEEYQDAMRAAAGERDKEEGRLGRRWAKLVDLHFNPTVSSHGSALPTLPRSPSISTTSTADKRRSILSIDGAFDALKGSKEVWKGVKTNLDPRGGPVAEENRKRAAEQAIVKWEDDGEARKCRICQAAFGLSNRKHHCRLCGRLVCSLPPTPAALLAVQTQLSSPGDSSTPILPPGTRREKCSLLLVADWKTGRGEEVDEGFVGWMKLQDGDEPVQINGKKERKKGRTSTSSTAIPMTALDGEGEKRDLPLPQQPKEVQVKGVRACRECWAVVSRKQKIADRQRVNGFARLYSGLRALQAEIEDTMPDFEEQMDILTSSPELKEPNNETLNLHKQLLTLFAQYEHLSKRISSLPVEEGSSQSTVQSAVARTAATFLAKEMIKIQALQKLQKKVADAKRKTLGSSVVETTLADQLKKEGVNGNQAVDVAMALQPLLEQENQLETMITDAKAQRKYEDSKALSMALEEIRLEIGRITSQAIP